MSKYIDLKDLSRTCREPDPFTFDECFESCDDYDGKNWDVSLGEIDFDENLDATIFTYTVNVWKGGVCQRNKNYGHFDSDDDSDEYKLDNDDNKDNDPSGIEGFYILNNGCCNNSEPIHFTKAITPKIEFQFLSIGWYWKNLIYPGFQNLFGFMIFGDVESTVGNYCVRTRYFCICKEIVVPDLCKINQDINDKTKKWTKAQREYDDSMEISDKAMWDKND